MVNFSKGFRSLNVKLLGSVGQMAAKLLAVKVGALKKKSAASNFTAEECASAFVPGSTSPGIKPSSKFDRL